jgi:hypothetical protein
MCGVRGYVMKPYDLDEHLRVRGRECPLIGKK